MGRVELQNAPMRALVQSLWGRYQQDTVFIDETGIMTHIDLTYNSLLTDPLEEAIASLRQQGIEVQLTNRRMKVFVVKPSSMDWGGQD
jgi:short-subunit dehydrogenase involved in D-alanine esterification of teichoic acids